MTDKFRLGDEVVINNPSSKFHRHKGIITNINYHTGRSTWVTVEIRTNDKIVHMLFPDYRFLMKVNG